ncbi:hypothetical protein [Aurantiacibacter aquimixticola]|uniref:Uncharacterized protein n=1 Tax=Aurantiacibacter aquimixticola TaxID=1958945 RepID=A0A419RT71_9SPHN|nr:hypothetical protein [Aurantiacibacter aquimixticola]RJY08969.1 hypothetical protein D6201_05970 [Aurantiacibacter aquimixticola]
MGITAITGAMALAFAAIHIFVGRLHFLSVTPRSRWLSFAGGVAVGYIFLHVLPELAAHQREFAEEMGVDRITAESVVYSLALAGLATFYGLERLVQRGGEAGDAKRMQRHVLYLHTVSYGALNLLIGYLLLQGEEEGAWGLALYFTAMSLHFVTADFGMREDNRAAYDRIGRWIITACVIAGWLLGLVLDLSKTLIGCLFAFLAGGIVLNVLKEELPEERQSAFLPFLFGTLLYAALVIAERHGV